MYPRAFPTGNLTFGPVEVRNKRGRGTRGKTITSDNGKEFAYHKEVSEALDTNFYFAHPYSS